MKQYLIIASIVLTPVLLAFGCSTVQVQNFFATVEKLETAYCAESNAENRAWLLSKIREKHPGYPEGGLCAFEPGFDITVTK